jgi:hypothetical protein
MVNGLQAIAGNTALEGAHENLHTLLACDGFDTEYALGVATNIARGEGRSSAVRHLARALVVPEARLHLCARVVRAFPPDAARRIRARRTSYGRPLSFDHLIQLSRVPDERMRDLLVEEAIAELLTVEELKAEIDQVADVLWWRRATPEQALRRATRMMRTIRRRLPMLVVVASGGVPDERKEARRAIRVLRECTQEISDALAAVLGGKNEDCLN